MTTPQDFFDTFMPSSMVLLEDRLPEDVVVAFHVDGSDGGSWQIERLAEGPRIGPVGGGPKDCEMWCSSDTFMRMLKGSLGSNRAFLSGRLRISGDVGLALALEDVLREAA